MLNKLDNRDILAAGFILVGAILRFYGFADWSLTNDELSALSRTNFNSFSELIEKGIWVDGHPALVQVFEYYWINLFGTTAFALRLPFVAMGIGSCIFFYRLCSTWLNKNAALLGLSIFTSTYSFVLYSQIARPYVVGLFLTLGFAFYFFRFLTGNRTAKNGVFLVVFGVAASISHYFATLGIFIIYLLGLFYLNKENAKQYFGFAMIMVLLYCIHLPITLNHLSIGGVTWLAPPTSDFLQRYLTYFFNDSPLLIGLIAVTLIALGFFKGLTFRWKPFVISILAFYVVYYIGYTYSLEKVPVLQFSTLIFSSPFLLVALFSVVGNKISFKITTLLSLCLLLASGYSLIQGKQLYAKKPFSDFKAVAENSVKWTKEYDEDAVFSIANVSNPFYLEYYTRQLSNNFGFDLENVSSPEAIAAARDKINATDAEYILISYANTPVAAEVHEFAKKRFPKIAKHQRYFNSEAILYGKENVEREAYFQTHYLDGGKWNVAKNKLQNQFFLSDSIAFKIDSTTEYAMSYKDTLKHIIVNRKNALTLSAQLHSDKPSSLNLVVSVSRNDSTIYWRGADIKPYYEPNKWFQFIYVFQAPVELRPTDFVSIYFWNPEKSNVFVDEFKLYNFADSDYNYYEF